MTEPLTASASATAGATSDWVDLIPEGLLPSDWPRERLAQTLALGEVSNTRRSEVFNRIAHLEAQIDERGADLAADPGEMLPLATELGGWQRIAQSLREAPGLPAQLGDLIAGGYTRQAFGGLELGPAPLFAAEVLHCMLRHTGQPQPFPDDIDLTVIELFEEVSRESVRHHQTVAVLSEPLRGARLEDRVRAIHAYATGHLAEHRAKLEKVREVVQVNALGRRASPRAHHCPFNNGTVLPLQDPIPSDRPWSFADATTLRNGSMANGRPPEFNRITP